MIVSDAVFAAVVIAAILVYVGYQVGRLYKALTGGSVKIRTEIIIHVKHAKDIETEVSVNPGAAK